MSNGRKIAESMTNFAKGVFSAGTNNARKQVAKGFVNEGAGIAGRKAAFKTADKVMKTNAYEFGAAVGNAKVFSGIANSFKEHELGATALQAIKKGHMVNGQLSAGRIAGTAATIGVAGRVATGGGLYRDRYGNFNLPGVPFI